MSPVPGLTQEMLHANNSVCRPLQLVLHQTQINEGHLALTCIKQRKSTPRVQCMSNTDNMNPEQYCKFSQTLDAIPEIYKRDWRVVSWAPGFCRNSSCLAPWVLWHTSKTFILQFLLLPENSTYSRDDIKANFWLIFEYFWSRHTFI